MMTELSKNSYYMYIYYLSNTDDLPVPAPCLLENRYMNSCYNWMAPEVMANNAVTEKADLYSLTCVLWELIHGKKKSIILSLKGFILF